MSKTISHISQLPDWFNLEKYDSAKDLDATGWYLQLRRRAIYSRHFDNLKGEHKAFLEKKHEKELEQIHSEGVIRGSLHEYVHDLKPIIDGKAVEELTVLDVNHLMKDMYSLIDGWDEITRKVPNLNAGSLPESKWERLTDDECKILLDQISKHQLDWSKVFLKLDLNLPDNLIIQQFTSLLKDKRASLDQNIIKPAKRRPDFDGWVKAGVLPYIDLAYWAQSQGARITNRCMADAIFRHGEGGEEVVRKTTKVMAEQLLDWRVAHYLYALSQDEKSENPPE
jgi:hypothetical protein